MRTIGRFALALVVLGLMLGFTLRGRWPRSRLPALLALALVPAVVHALVSAWSAQRFGVDSSWLALYLVSTSAAVAMAWRYAVRLSRERPFSAALVVPGHALAQAFVTGLLERAVVALGHAFDPLGIVALGGAAIVAGGALAVVLPTRAHLTWLPRAPRWWRALLRALGKR